MPIEFDFIGFGKATKSSRNQRRVSLKQMAQLTGLSISTISRCERGLKSEYETIATLSFVSWPYVDSVWFNGVSAQLLTCVYAIQTPDPDKVEEWIKSISQTTQTPKQ